MHSSWAVQRAGMGAVGSESPAGHPTQPLGSDLLRSLLTILAHAAEGFFLFPALPQPVGSLQVIYQNGTHRGDDLQDAAALPLLLTCYQR